MSAAIAAIVAEFQQLQQALGTSVERCDGRDLERTKVVSPFNASAKYNLYSALIICAPISAGTCGKPIGRCTHPGIEEGTVPYSAPTCEQNGGPSLNRNAGAGFDRPVTRRHALAAMAAIAAAPAAWLRAAPAVTTLIGNGAPGLSDTQVNNPYGVMIGPFGLYFCDLDNQRIRLININNRRSVTVAGTGERGHSGDGQTANLATLNMPHEVVFDRQGNIYIAERDSHVVRKIAFGTAIISTVAGTGEAGFSGDDGPANQAQLRQPHSIAIDPNNGLLICDIGNQRIRRVDLATGIITTWAGTGAAQTTPDGAPRVGTPLQGPRTFAFAPDGTLYLALREGNAILRLDRASDTWTRIAGAGGRNGYAGDGGPARDAQLGGPKGLAFDARQHVLFIADTENHVIRKVDLATGIITTALGTGVRGDGPETSPLECKLARPHGLCVDPQSGVLYVADSEAHRIRILTS